MGRRHKVLTLRELNIPKSKLVDKRTREVARNILRRSQRTGHYWVLIDYLYYTGVCMRPTKRCVARELIEDHSDFLGDRFSSENHVHEEGGVADEK